MDNIPAQNNPPSDPPVGPVAPAANAPSPATPGPTAPRTVVPAQLRISAGAWARLRYYQSQTTTEIGGFCITEAGDPFGIVDIYYPPQEVSGGSVDFDDEGLAHMVDELVAQGLTPENFFRIWIHTHPGDSTTPSGKDEKTFQKILGSVMDWSVMLIIGKDGSSYSRLQTASPRAWLPNTERLMLPLVIDYELPYPASDHNAWDEEFLARVTERVFTRPKKGGGGGHGSQGKFNGGTGTIVGAAGAAGSSDVDEYPLLHMKGSPIPAPASGHSMPTVPLSLSLILAEVYRVMGFADLQKNPNYTTLSNRTSEWVKKHYPQWSRSSPFRDDVALYLDNWGLTAQQWHVLSLRHNQDYTVVLQRQLQEHQDRAVSDRPASATTPVLDASGQPYTVSPDHSDDPADVAVQPFTYLG